MFHVVKGATEILSFLKEVKPQSAIRVAALTMGSCFTELIVFVCYRLRHLECHFVRQDDKLYNIMGDKLLLNPVSKFQR